MANVGDSLRRLCSLQHRIYNLLDVYLRVHQAVKRALETADLQDESKSGQENGACLLRQKLSAQIRLGSPRCSVLISIIQTQIDAAESESERISLSVTTPFSLYAI